MQPNTYNFTFTTPHLPPLSRSNVKMGFNGKESIDEVSGEGNEYDYGFRVYNPRIGRFLSVDPLTKSFPWYTPYQFAGNKPIWAIDLDGLEEYYTSSGQLIGKYGTSTEIRIVHKDYIEATKDITSNQNQPGSDVMNDKLFNTGSHGVFKTNDEAAIDWAQNVNPKSIQDNLEYGSTLYELEIKGEKYITYVEPAKGSPAGVYTDRESPAPEGKKRTGIIHSHGAYDPRYKNNEFSGSDRSNADRRQADSYVVTPNGSLQRYDVCDKKDSTIKTNIPSDPKDPKRLNEVAPEKPLPIVVNQK